MMTYKKDTKTKKHIILADDEGPLRRSIKLILRQSGYKVTALADGQMALKTILDLQHTTEAADLLITDLQMGGLNGIDLIDSVRKNNVQLPILVLTGYGNKDTVVQLLRKGCSEYLDKPLDPNDLLRRVEKILQQHQQRENEIRQVAIQEEKNRESLNSDLESYRQTFRHLADQVASQAVNYQELIHLVPSAYNVRVVYHNRPFTEQGGAFIDIANTPSGCDLFMANVTGNDLDATYYNLLMKAFFQENCRTGYHGHSFFDLLNKQLRQCGLDDRRTSALFARINLRTMSVDLISAGHPAPIKIRRGIPVPSRMTVHGDPLGIQDNIAFENRSFIITPSDRIILFSEGLLNSVTQNPAQLAPGDYLETLINRTVNSTLQEQVDAVWNEVLENCHQDPKQNLLLAGLEMPEKPMN